MKTSKCVLLTTLILVQISLCSAQEGLLGKAHFKKISVPENITEQMLTQDKESIWIFTDKYLTYLLGDAEGVQLKVSIFQYDSKTSMYTFVCTDNEKKEFNVQFKNSAPKHVLIQGPDGRTGFICHD